MKTVDLRIDADALGDLCRRYEVARLDAFGSFAAGDATDDSDVDLLVTFLPEAEPGLAFVALVQELEALLGRPVDLPTRRTVEASPNKYFRRFALRCTEPVYECAVASGSEGVSVMEGIG